MNFASLQPMIEHLTGRFVNGAADGLLLLCAVWCLLRFAGRPNAKTRFSVWFLALLGIAALPLLSTHAATLAQKVGAEITLSTTWALALFSAWAVGATILMLRLAHGLWRVHRLRKACEPASAALNQELAIEFPRDARLLLSDSVEVPAAIGFFRPAVIVPRALLAELSIQELRAVVLHELAHLERCDDWSNLAQKFVKAILFFHPAVWWIERRLTLEREMACDDIVLARTGGARAYASCLVSFAEKMQRMRTLALVQPLVDRMCQLTRRVAEILDADRPRSPQLRKPLLCACCTLIVAAAVAVPYLPHLIAFSGSAPQLTSAQPISPSSLPRAQAARAIPASYIAPAESAHFNRKAPVAKAAKLKRRPAPALPYRAIALRQDQPGPLVPTLVIFESTTVQTDTGTQVWQLCIWQLTPANTAVTPSSEREI